MHAAEAAARQGRAQAKLAAARPIARRGARAAAAASFTGRARQRRELAARCMRCIEAQAYRLAYWRVAADEINYRRFFDINDLAALRIELPEALRATCTDCVLRLVGRRTARRAAHRPHRRPVRSRGLLPAAAAPAAARRRRPATSTPGREDPGAARAAAATGRSPAPPATTSLNQVAGLFVDRAERRLPRLLPAPLHRRATRGFDDVALLPASCASPKSISRARLKVLAQRVPRARRSADRRTRDFTRNGCATRCDEVMAAFPGLSHLCRRDGRAATSDRRYIDWAVALAQKRRRRQPTPRSSTSSHGVLTGDLAAGAPAATRARCCGFAMRFQQLTGPVMAKGARGHRLLPLRPAASRSTRSAAIRGRFGVTVAAFHRRPRSARKRWPHADAGDGDARHQARRGCARRASPCCPSCRPSGARRVALWARSTGAARRDRRPSQRRRHRRVPVLSERSSAPGRSISMPADAAAAARPSPSASPPTMLKAVREAQGAVELEQPQRRLRGGARPLRRGRARRDAGQRLSRRLARLRRAARPARARSTAWRRRCSSSTAPGVPDLYQGSELWDFSLVDPDNRRPVDFARRRALLAGLPASEDETHRQSEDHPRRHRPQPCAAGRAHRQGQRNRVFPADDGRLGPLARGVHAR